VGSTPSCATNILGNKKMKHEIIQKKKIKVGLIQYEKVIRDDDTFYYYVELCYLAVESNKENLGLYYGTNEIEALASYNLGLGISEFLYRKLFSENI
jgi:hypothetical protein